MAIVFESSATTTDTATNSITATKPTGVEVGDLLVCVGYGYRTLGHVDTPTGWTELWNADGVLGDNWAQYKVADSGDVSATNYTWSFYDDASETTTDGVDDAKVVIYRISGFSGDAEDIYSVTGVTANDATPTFTADFDPISPNGGLIMQTRCSDSTENVSYSDYEIISAGANPTWTEVYDDSWGSDEMDISLAHAIYEDNDAITGFGYTITSATISSVAGALIVIRAQNPVPDPVPVVESVSSASTISGGSVTVTAPTGITTGDLLVGFFSAFRPGGTQTSALPAGWTDIQAQSTSGTRLTARAFYKIAELADESATDYTFTSSGADYCQGAILRISGAASGSEITVSEVDYITNNASTSISHTATSTPISVNSLAIIYATGHDFSITATVTTSGYTSTPSATWTERADIGHRDGVSDGSSLAVATAPITDPSEITNYSYTQSEVLDETIGMLILVNTANAFYGSSTIHTADPTLFTNSPSGDTNTSVSLLEIDPAVQTTTAKATSPTQWTNEADTDTTWTNEASL